MNEPRPPLQVEYKLDDAIAILRAGFNTKFQETRRLRPSVLDQFLFSGRFNSVLGLDGFKGFKQQLRTVIDEVNSDDFGPKLLTLDKMADALLGSGVYYVEEYLPEELAYLKHDQRWLTAYRYIARNFPAISHADFRTLVNRFKDSRGHSVHVDPDDSELLRSMVGMTELFQETIDAKAALMGMGQAALRAICEKAGAHPGRSLEETSDRIVAAAGDRVADLIPEKYKTRRILVIKDRELATGADVIQLDEYLRAISKVVREDLIKFVDHRRFRQWGGAM